MIHSYKNRFIESDQRVMVYRNLHTGNFSIKCQKTKLVLAHGTDFILSDVELIVNQSGRERVLKEKKKNVHAYAVGKLEPLLEPILQGKEAYYNPYQQDHFTDKETGEKLSKLDVVFFSENKLKY